jgi:hypothetical protein
MSSFVKGGIAVASILALSAVGYVYYIRDNSESSVLTPAQEQARNERDEAKKKNLEYIADHGRQNVDNSVDEPVDEPAITQAVVANGGKRRKSKKINKYTRKLKHTRKLKKHLR